MARIQSLVIDLGGAGHQRWHHAHTLPLARTHNGARLCPRSPTNVVYVGAYVAVLLASGGAITEN
jgi:hypothetical protein